MRRTAMLTEVFVTRFEETYTQYRKRRLTGEEAGQLLGMSGRNFRRLCGRYEEEGVEGLRDRRLGRPSPRRASERELERMKHLFCNRYSKLNVRHFHEHLQDHHDYRLSYTLTRLTLQKAGLVAKGMRPRGKHRTKRERRPMRGMMLFQDGSTHRWIPGLDHDLDLIVTLDDATGELYSAFVVEQEGTLSSFRGLAETISAHGLFGSFYTDRGSHYFHTPEAGGPVDKRRLTQVGRGLAQTGITHIASYSPEARGRMERVFGTLQGRLPQEFELAGITSVAEADRFLKEHFVPDYNRRFAVEPAEPGSAFIPYAGLPLAEVLCIQEQRRVGRDNCINWDGRSLQIPPQRHRHHYVKAIVRVHQYPHGGFAIFDGPRCLARFNDHGKAIDAPPKAA